jgi:hypothetical protein
MSWVGAASTTPEVDETRGPSILVAVSSGQRAAVALGGYRLNLATWEQRLPHVACTARRLGGLNVSVFGDVDIFDDRARWATWTLEVVRDGLTDAQTDSILTSVMPEHLADAIRAALSLKALPINVNRNLELDPPLPEFDTAVFDLEISTLPTRRGDPTAALAFTRRRARFLTLPGASLVQWSTVLEKDRWPSDIRWSITGSRRLMSTRCDATRQSR